MREGKWRSRNLAATAYPTHSRALISVSYGFISPDLWSILADLLHLLLNFFLLYSLLHLLWLDLGKGLFQHQKGLQKSQKPRKIRANSGSFLVGLWRCLFSLMVCALCSSGVYKLILWLVSSTTAQASSARHHMHFDVDSTSEAPNASPGPSQQGEDPFVAPTPAQPSNQVSICFIVFLIYF